MPNESNDQRTWDAFFWIQTGNLALIYVIMGGIGLAFRAYNQIVVGSIIAVAAILVYYRLCVRITALTFGCHQFAS